MGKSLWLIGNNELLDVLVELVACRVGLGEMTREEEEDAAADLGDEGGDVKFWLLFDISFEELVVTIAPTVICLRLMRRFASCLILAIRSLLYWSSPDCWDCWFVWWGSEAAENDDSTRNDDELLIWLTEPNGEYGILAWKTLEFFSALASIIIDDDDVVVVRVVPSGRRRLAEWGKSNRPPLVLFWPFEFNGGIVVQQAILFVCFVFCFLFAFLIIILFF